MKKMNDEFRKQLAGYGLTTANIIYRMPDHPAILQEYIWQEYDVAPDLPILHNFLAFWQLRIEGRLAHVTIGHQRLISPVEVNCITELN